MFPTKPNCLRLHPSDEVVVALADLPEGAELDGAGVLLAGPVPAGHKAATAPLAAGAAVHKYGQLIGFAKADIAPGEHVHTHNLGLGPGRRAAAAPGPPPAWDPPPAPEPAAFMGFRRRDGRAGTRNYVGVLATVNCAASLAHMLADRARAELLPDFANVDGVVALGHGGGCTVVGEGLDVLRRCLAGFMAHPNFGGVLLLGLGCETNLAGELVGFAELAPGPRLEVLEIQAAGGSGATLRAGMAALGRLLARADQDRRVELPASELVLGLECGGSDAWSGVSANPVLGAAADLLVAAGGTVVLGETPEVYGAEHLLTRRAVSPAVAARLMERIAWWEEHTARHGTGIDNNPSPGNKAGGLTTIWEKSLGAVAKAGTSPLVEVCGYAQPVRARGLVHMDTPGYDPVSLTGLIAGGANLVAFTTGRGSVCSLLPAPTLKLSTTTGLYERMPGDIDLDCGPVLSGGAGITGLGRDLYRLLIETASGRASKSEAQGFGQHEFTPWPLGAVL